MKTTRKLKLLMVLTVGLAVVFTIPAIAQEEPPLVEELEMPGVVEGTGTYFEVTDSEYLNVTLLSSESIILRLESVPEMVIIDIEAAEDATSTEIILTGFEPLTTYYKYEDDHHNGAAFTTDEYGIYVYTQDLTNPHHVFIQTQPGTIYLSNSGWSDENGNDPSVGIWDPDTQTGTLTTDVYETIQIDSDGITLDGNGHTITGSGGGYGVYLSGRNGVTIQNLIVESFNYGIYLVYCSGNTLNANVLTNNDYGIILSLSSNNNLTGNTANSNNGGINVSRSGNNSLTGNTANSNSFSGIYIYISSYTTLADNTASNNGYGIVLEAFKKSSLTGNTANSNNYHGIYLYNSFNNTLADNTANSNNYYGMCFHNSSYNSVTGNTANSNNCGILLSLSSNTLTGNTVSWNSVYGVWLRYYSWDNHIYNNNFIDNPTQAYVSGDCVGNVFNLEEPIGGNYWSDWTSPDDDGDGFVDFPYIFDGGQDDLPWTRQNGWLNQPPEVTIASPPSGFVAPVNEDILFEGGIADPDIGDTHTAIWTISTGDWSEDYEGTVSETLVSDLFQFPEAGIYSIRLTVTDAAGASGETSTVNNNPECPAFVVIYNPDGGFVTGGGWIDSPEGAYKPDLLLTGRANFGFVSKYKKGADVPTGNTEFQFKTGDLNFHSSSYDWLVVTGSNYARFKGSGSINDEGDFKFMLWAGDSEPDRFRIKIWEEDELENELVVYDNGMDQEIGGGSIVVHTK